MITSQTFSKPTPAHGHHHDSVHSAVPSTGPRGTVDHVHLGEDHPPEIQRAWEGQMPQSAPNPDAAPINASTGADLAPSRPRGAASEGYGVSSWAAPGRPVIDAWNLRDCAPTSNIRGMS